jgi:hypothetical protein
MSLDPPGGKVTTSRTGWRGHAVAPLSARAGIPGNAGAASAAARNCLLEITMALRLYKRWRRPTPPPNLLPRTPMKAGSA